MSLGLISQARLISRQQRFCNLFIPDAPALITVAINNGNRKDQNTLLKNRHLYGFYTNKSVPFTILSFHEWNAIRI